MQNKPRLKIVGITNLEEIVVSGCFYFKDSQGVPIIDIMTHLEKYNIKMGIFNYIDEALQAGQKFTNIKAELIEALTEKFGKKNWEERLSAYQFTKDKMEEFPINR